MDGYIFGFERGAELTGGAGSAYGVRGRPKGVLGLGETEGILGKLRANRGPLRPGRHRTPTPGGIARLRVTFDTSETRQVQARSDAGLIVRPPAVTAPT